MNQLRERHRRLCTPCAKAPLKTVACPSLDLALPRGVEMMQRSLCDCESAGVWLCQPCGRTIRNADGDYIRYIFYTSSQTVLSLICTST